MATELVFKLIVDSQGVPKIKMLSEQLAQSAAASKGAQAGVTGVTGKLGGLNAALDRGYNSGLSFSSLAKTGFGLTLGYKAISLAQDAIMAIPELLFAATREAIGFESSFAGVRKTVDSTEAEFQFLERALRDSSLQIPIAVDELNALAESAGQLGIHKANIVDFTEVMAKLKVSTNLGEEGPAQLARFANITRMSQGDFERLGSTIVDLGNNFATTEQDIVEFAMRIAGAGSTVGMSEADILGLATALSSVGLEAQMGGTAISRVMVDIASSVSKGGGELKQFADIAGMSAQSFSQLFRQDAAGGVQAFIVGLGRIRDSGGDVLAVLESLGIKDVRLRDTLLRAAGASDLLSNALDKSSTAWEENVALQEEASKRFDTVESKIQLLKNSATDLGITVGKLLTPVVKSGVEEMAVGFQDLERWVRSNQASLQQYVVGGVSIATDALAAGVRGAGFLAAGIQSLIAIVDGARAGFYGFAQATNAIVIGALELATTFPGVATKVLGLEGNLESMKGKLIELRDEQGKYGNEAKNAFGEQAQAMVDTLTNTEKLASGIEASGVKLRDAAAKGVTAMADGLGKVGEEMERVGGATGPAVTGVRELSKEAAKIAGVGKDFVETLTAVEELGDASRVSSQQLKKVAETLMEGAAAGKKLPPVAEAVVERWMRIKDAEQELKDFNELLDEQRKIASTLGPDARTITDEYLNLSAAYERIREQGSMGGGWDALSDEQLKTVVNKLREMQKNARAAGVEIEGLPEDLAEAWRELQTRLASMPPGFFEKGKEAGQSFGSGMKAALDKLPDVILGAIQGGGDIGKAIGASLGGDLGKGLSGLIGSSGITGWLGSFLPGIGSMLGSKLGGIVDGIVGAFSKPEYERAMEEVGRDYGTKISEGLGKEIEATAANLNLGRFEATLLHLADVMSEGFEQGAGLDQFTQGIEDLFNATASGAVPATQGIQEIGDSFSVLAEQAEAGSAEAEQAMLAMTLRARNLGMDIEAITEHTREALSKAQAGIAATIAQYSEDEGQGGRYMGGLQLVSPDVAKAQASVFSTTFWASVKEFGMVDASDAMRDSFAGLKESLTEALPAEEINKLLAPMQRMMNLTAPGDESGPKALFRGAAEAAQGLADNLRGLADSGYLTQEAFNNFGTLAQAAFDQAKAGGATSKEAIQAILPELQAAVDAANRYGYALDPATEKLKAQAEAAGFAFPVEPQQVMIDLLSTMVELMGGELPESAQRAKESFQEMGTSVSGTLQETVTQVGESADTMATDVVGKIGTAADSMASAMDEFAGGTKESLSLATESMKSGSQEMASAMTQAFVTMTSDARMSTEEIAAYIRGLGDMRVNIPFSYSGSGAPGIPGGPDIPRAASGAIVPPTPGGSHYIIGEAGEAELVAPVRAFADTLASRIISGVRGQGAPAGAAQGGGQPIVVHVQVPFAPLITFFEEAQRANALRVRPESVQPFG